MFSLCRNAIREPCSNEHTKKVFEDK